MKKFIKFCRYLKPLTKKLILLFFLILITIIITVPTPYIQKLIIDKVIPNNDIYLLFFYVILLVIIYFCSNIFDFFKNFISVKIRNNVLTRIRIDLYEHLQKMSMHFFSKKQTGALLSRILNDVGFIQHLINDELFIVISSLIKTITIVIILIKISVKLTLLCAILSPIIIFIFLIFKKKYYIINKKFQETLSNLSGKIQENLSFIKLIKAENLENYKKEETYKYSTELEHISNKIGMTNNIGKFFIMLFTIIPLFIIIWGIGGVSVFNKELSLGSLIAYMQYLFITIDTVDSFFRFSLNLQTGLSALDRVNEILDYKPDIEDADNAIEISKQIKNIHFKNVSVSFPGRDDFENTTTVLKRISFKVNRGEKIAIVGPSGGGKSSLINLLLKFNVPTKGNIFFNNKSINTYKVKSIRDKIGYIPQEEVLFNDSIKNNLTLWRNYDERELEKAIKISGAEELIASLKDGLNTIIGERGLTLSGGERQRLALVRALLKKPDLYIFDEALSALDTKKEESIIRSLKKVLSQYTIIIITHRFSLLKLVDRILVIAEGKLIEDGNFNSLYKNKGMFYQLYKTQYLSK